MTALQHSDQHPVPALAHWLREELASLAGAPLWSMTAAEAADALLLLTRARSQLDELLMRVLRHAESVEVGTDLGATTANWWAHTSQPAARGGAPDRASGRSDGAPPRCRSCPRRG